MLRLEREPSARATRALGLAALPINASAWHDGRLYVRLAGARAGGELRPAASWAESGSTGRRGAAWWVGVRDQTQEFFALERSSDLARGECLWRLSVPATAAPLSIAGRQFIEWHGAQRWWRTAAAAQRGARGRRAGGRPRHADARRGSESGGVFTPLSDGADAHAPRT